MRRAVLLLAACAVAGLAQAQGASAPVAITIELSYPVADERFSEPLVEIHKTLIADKIAGLKTVCKTWPEGATATLVYSFPAATLPRKDYQRMGERVEALGIHLARLGLSRVEVRIDSDARNKAKESEALKDAMLVTLACTP